MAITPNSKVPFGKHPGILMKNCSESFLRWMVGNLPDSDLCEYAAVARQILAEKSADRSGGLEQQADEFLRSHGIDPTKI